MKNVNVIIEKSKDLYNIYSHELEGCYGIGETIDEAKKSFFEGIELYKEFNQKLSSIYYEELNFQFQYDIESFLAFYKGVFTNSALERLTGINQKQIQHYASGLKKPRIEQRKKIEASLHNLGEELLALRF